jgi:hypothetical protein
MPRKRGRLPTKATPTTRRKESKMVAPNPVYPPETAPEGPFAPYYSEDGTCILCWSCHGYLVRPEGTRLCACDDPGPFTPAAKQKLRALEAVRDSLATAYQRRLFRVVLPLLEGDIEAGEAAWLALWGPSRALAANRLAARGIS